MEIDSSYKTLFNLEIYKAAYDKIKANQGNLVTAKESLDGVSME